ncbi:hypothetical protein ABH931_007457 [Streptacidiphilus sp. MAP12-33]|uniref:DUF6193 family natural product biosynthesis protein n=1 Tax=Streptacidiphilus sp. MAP12-33 TaxID=3156266 RepID=UPI00351966CB
MEANNDTSDQHPLLPPRPVLPDMVAARSRGPADTVDARWRALQLKAQWEWAVHEIRSPGRPYPRLVTLLEVAAAQPRLRRLYPFTSHFALVFSSSTTYAWRAVQAGSIEPLHNGRFKVRRHRPFVICEVDTPEEAVNAVLELLPAGSDPIITASPDRHA